MQPRTLSDKTLDLCAHCGGIWIDEGDGEIAQACRAARDALGDAPPVPPHGPERLCPQCAVGLVVEAEGPRPFLRCPSCAGAWISRRIAKAIAEVGYTRGKLPFLDRSFETLPGLLGILLDWGGRKK